MRNDVQRFLLFLFLILSVLGHGRENRYQFVGPSLLETQVSGLSLHPSKETPSPSIMHTVRSIRIEHNKRGKWRQVAKRRKMAQNQLKMGGLLQSIRGYLGLVPAAEFPIDSQLRRKHVLGDFLLVSPVDGGVCRTRNERQ